MISRTTKELYQARQEVLVARSHVDDARDWIRSILREANNCPESEEEFRDEMCPGDIETVRAKCKAARC